MACACSKAREATENLVAVNDSLGGNRVENILSHEQLQQPTVNPFQKVVSGLKDWGLKILKILFFIVFIPVVILFITIYTIILTIANSVFGKDWGMQNPVNFYIQWKQQMKEKVEQQNKNS